MIVVISFHFQVFPTRDSSSWIQKTTPSVTVWRWCRVPCPSPATWRETRHTATRSCVTPGTLQAEGTFYTHNNVFTSAETLTCFPHRPLPRGSYVVHVKVDGLAIPDSKICWGRPSWCSFYVSSTVWLLHQVVPCSQVWIVHTCFCFPVSPQSVWYRTPTVSDVDRVSGPPGTGLTSSPLVVTSDQFEF